MKRLALLALVAFALPARACLNDRDSDSLATQAAQLPATLRVITGRFERNPPLYYRMRIEREHANLAKNPRQFGLYDDIGVALDKLGRDDEALQTMARKRDLLPAFNPDDKANREAWYRTFANEGTFRAHRYLKNQGSYDAARYGKASAPAAELSEMKLARAQIKRAIEIKPDAHFGRERYQLMAMDWILARKSDATKKTLGEWIAARDGWEKVDGTTTLNGSNRGRAVAGLGGLIVLGGAWQSPDVFEALGAALETKDGVTLRYLTFLRVQELLEEGKPSLWQSEGDSSSLSVNDSQLGKYGIAVNGNNEGELQKLAMQLRTEAEGWNVMRQNWMMVKMNRGAHPDTDAKFWDGYWQSEPPSLNIEWYNWSEEVGKANREGVAVLCFGGAVICAGVLLFRWRRRLKVASGLT